MDIKELNEQFKKILENEVHEPSETDLDNVYDAIKYLNDWEWIVKTEQEAKILQKVQEILQKYL